ncbi:MAG TPA: Uma2 family endonuclease [Terracidiphilus sp.]|jgi:Uma2 family endonuclease|nr:Uma2 family endonuclease [Terracidiphilus sp.]
MAAATSLITVDEYLKTTADPDCEYVAGKIETRPAPLLDHSDWQAVLLHFFGSRRLNLNIRALPSLRMRVAPDRFRVPDVAVLSRLAPREQIVTHPPLAVFEILSPEDSMTRMLEKLADYERMGIGAIWVIKPKKPSYFQYAEGKLAPASVFALPGSSFHVPMEEIAKLID